MLNKAMLFIIDAVRSRPVEDDLDDLVTTTSARQIHCVYC